MSRWSPSQRENRRKAGTVKLTTSEPGIIVSGLAHAALLIAGLVVFGSTQPFPETEEAIAVEVVDSSALTQITRGEKSAEKVQEQPLPRAERKSEIVEKKDPGEARTDTPAPPTRPAEIKVAEETKAPPAPPPKAAQKAKSAPEEEDDEPKKEPAKAPPKPAEIKLAEPKPELRKEQLAKLVEDGEIAARAKAAEEEAKAAAKSKAEADAKAKAEAAAKAAAAAKAKAEAEAKAEAAEEAKEKAQAEAAAKAEADAKAKALAIARAKADAEAKARRDAEAAKKFNAADISKLLQSKEPAASTGAAAPAINKTASLGAPTATGQKLNPSMRGQLMGLIKDQLNRCWQPPIGAATSAKPVIVSVRFKSNPDGSLAGEPAVTNSSSDPLFRPTADTATRAVRRCSPLRIPAQFTPFYEDWKNIIVNFDTSDT